MKATSIIAIVSFSLILASSAQEVNAKPIASQSLEGLQAEAKQSLENLVRAAQAYNALPKEVRAGPGRQSVRGAYQLLRANAHKHPDLVLNDELSVQMEWSLVLSAAGKLRSAPLLNKLVLQNLAEASIAKFRRKAQSIASTFNAAMATGTTGLDDVKTVEEAIQRVNAGVEGGGAFAGRPFTTKTSPQEAEAARHHLTFDLEEKNLRYTPTEVTIEAASEDSSATASDVIDVLATLIEPAYVLRRGPQPPNGTSGAAIAGAMRTAQSLASIFNAVMSTGTEKLDDVKGIDEVVERLNAGVKGGGPFADKLFVMKTTPEQAEAAKPYLKLDMAKKVLHYSHEPANSEVSTKTSGSTEEPAIPMAEGQLIARHLACAFAGAVATDTKELADVKTVDDAIKHLHKGVNGGGPFANHRFISMTTPEQAAAAKLHLKWDVANKKLLYTPKADKAQVSSKAAAPIAVRAEEFDPEREARRNAQSLYSTYVSASQAGCETFKKARSVDDIYNMLTKGVNGVGPWQKIKFYVTVSENELKAASAFLNLDARIGLTYME